MPRGGKQFLSWSPAESLQSRCSCLWEENHTMLRVSLLTGELPTGRYLLAIRAHTEASLGFPGRKASVRIQCAKDSSLLPGASIRCRKVRPRNLQVNWMQEVPAAESGRAVPWPPWIPQDAELQAQVLSCCPEVQLGASRVRAEGGHIIPGGQLEHPACSPRAP